MAAPVISGVTVGSGPYYAGSAYSVTITATGGGPLTYLNLGNGVTFSGSGSVQSVSPQAAGGPLNLAAVVSNGCGISVYPYSIGAVCSPLKCSANGQSVLGCNDAVVQQCTGTQACDPVAITCVEGCAAAVSRKTSVGCDFYATNMEATVSTPGSGLCFAAFVVNASNAPAHLSVALAGTQLPVASFTRIASGMGPSLSYSAYDAIAGVPPGGAAILFLAGKNTSDVPCPVTTAQDLGTMISGTGVGSSFEITTDNPISVFQMNPFGGGNAYVAGASLLLPTTSWGTNYLVATASPSNVTGLPSFNVVASGPGALTLRAPVAIAGGGVLPAGLANAPYVFSLTPGQQAQFSQSVDLTGSVIQAAKPIGVMAGNACMQVPVGTAYCDHGEQMLPPVSALGSQYVAVMFRPRVPGDQAIWRAVGVVDGTTLTYSTPVPGAPATLSAGQAVEFPAGQAFTMASQDSSHPFLLFAQMTGSGLSSLPSLASYGDPDTVVVVPPTQFLSRYSFYVDPTYPEANLVIVRGKNASQTFDDVTLDCAGVLTGWQAVGEYQWTRIDLVRHNFAPQGSCAAGAHTMTSASPFGVTVWGWGSPETTTFTRNVSYGYPAGMGVAPINSVVLTP